MIVLSGEVTQISSTKPVNTWIIKIHTQELTAEQKSEVSQLDNKLVFAAFKVNPFTNKESEIISALETDPDLEVKSLSERLRNVLFVWFKQNPQGFKSFSDFYQHFMGLYIDNIKGKLEP